MVTVLPLLLLLMLGLLVLLLQAVRGSRLVSVEVTTSTSVATD
jgi:hypothetical protein